MPRLLIYGDGGFGREMLAALCMLPSDLLKFEDLAGIVREIAA